jgi:hypothetical protein
VSELTRNLHALARGDHDNRAVAAKGADEIDRLRKVCDSARTSLLRERQRADDLTDEVADLKTCLLEVKSILKGSKSDAGAVEQIKSAISRRLLDIDDLTKVSVDVMRCARSAYAEAANLPRAYEASWEGFSEYDKVIEGKYDNNVGVQSAVRAIIADRSRIKRIVAKEIASMPSDGRHPDHVLGDVLARIAVVPHGERARFLHYFDIDRVSQDFVDRCVEAIAWSAMKDVRKGGAIHQEMTSMPSDAYRVAERFVSNMGLAAMKMIVAAASKRGTKDETGSNDNDHSGRG